MIPYGRQNVTDEDVRAVVDVLNSDFLTQGPIVEKFEQKISEKVNCGFSVAVNSATSALHIACLALGLKRGDILWTSGISFVASANCGIYCGARVDFVDIDPDTVNICLVALEKKLVQAEKNATLPKILVVVHMCGSPADLEKIHKLSARYKFKIIEDASHAIGAEYAGTKIGSCAYSDVTVFSFHPVKIITTGEGGVATTNDRNLAIKLKMLRSHGVTRDPDFMTKEKDGQWYYEQIDLGFNYRITDIQAALGYSQITRLEKIIKSRNNLALQYQKLFETLPVKYQKILPDTKSSYHLFVVQVESSISRKNVFDSLRKSGIGVNVHYIPIYRQPFYQKFNFNKADFKGCEKYYKSCISLPLYPELTNLDLNLVHKSLKKALQC